MKPQGSGLKIKHIWVATNYIVIVYQGFIYIPGAAGGISEPSSSITRRMDPPSFPPKDEKPRTVVRDF